MLHRLKSQHLQQQKGQETPQADCLRLPDLSSGEIALESPRRALHGPAGKVASIHHWKRKAYRNCSFSRGKEEGKTGGCQLAKFSVTVVLIVTTFPCLNGLSGDGWADHLQARAERFGIKT